MTALSRRIREWRGERLTQAKAAGKLGVSQSMIAEWERGSSVPSDASLRRISRVLRVPLSLLLMEASDAALDRARAAQ